MLSLPSISLSSMSPVARGFVNSSGHAPRSRAARVRAGTTRDQALAASVSTEVGALAVSRCCDGSTP
jgi:hypothetical protein